MKIIISFFLLIVSAATCQTSQKKTPQIGGVHEVPNKIADKIDGLNFVAPPNEFTNNPMPEVKAVNADWIAVVPFAFTRVGEPKVNFNSNYQWWGERPEGAKETIRLAKKSGLKIMLKPQVYIPRSWPGALDFSESSDWEKWEADYRDYIMLFAKMAVEEQVEIFCIGTEFKFSVRNRANFWWNLIKEIRTIYKGKLTYASNWDDYDEVPFWNELDYIGIDAYFPLVDAKTPSILDLKKAWKPLATEMEAFSVKEKKPILFTEFGYLTVDNCAWQNWELEKVIDDCQVNQQAQANALQGLFESFWNKDFWAGGFLWKWFPEGQGHEGFKPKDYTPQGKLGAKVLAEWYNESKK